jgi:hypothetical protein
MRRYRHLGGNLIGGDADSYEPELWNWLVDKYKVGSVVDLGCGEGVSSRYFREMGVPCLAVDGLQKNCEVAGFSLVHDFVDGPLRLFGFDLAWCCEVVEHIEERYLPNLLEAMRGAVVIAMTYAAERGHHHVNMKPEQYWIDTFTKFGFSFLEEDTKAARAVAQRKYFKGHGLMFSAR